MNIEQENAVNCVVEGNNTFVTGSAGVGKSFFINKLKSVLDFLKKEYVVLAPTGIAAVNVKGQTIHRFFSLRIETKTLDDYLQSCLKFSKIDWDNLTILIVDEVSMWNISLFNLCDSVCRFHKKSNLPFGGIQLVLVGDFYQLCPIREKSECIDDPLYIFETSLWDTLKFNVHVLKKVMRQNDTEFITILNNIRTGNVNRETRLYLKKLGEKSVDTRHHYIELYSKNVDKNKANETRVQRLPSLKKVFNSFDNGDSKYFNCSRVEKQVELKIGAPVMLLWNLTNDNLYNGSLGIIEEFTIEGLPKVRFNSGITRVIEKQKWEIKQKNSDGTTSLLASRKQIPLQLAYAMSGHKSQGSTLDHIIVDTRDTFASGQLYVMLSRASTPDGIILRNFDLKHIKVDKRVTDFYKTRVPLQE